jgi:hypothetical protein
MYTNNYSAFHADFSAANCVEYGGTACTADDGGDDDGGDDAASTAYCGTTVTHFNIEAETASAIVLSISNVDANTVAIHASSANDDVLDLLIVGAQTDVAGVSATSIEDGQASLTLTWADGAPASTSFEILWSKESTLGNWMLRQGELPSINTADSCAPDNDGGDSDDGDDGDDTVVDVPGCLDVNADNYNADATVQGLDQYGNLACDYSSCDDIPDAEGCFYANNYSAFKADFTPSNCVQYGGTACTAEVQGCIDALATNYDASATAQAVDQYGNLLCVYTSCDDVPNDGVGCMYAESYGAYHADFDGAACEGYGGTACSADDGGDDSTPVTYTQAELDAAVAAAVAAVEPTTQDIALDLPQGWSMFGFTCLEAQDALEAFAPVSDQVIIVKDENGLAYLPEYGFNGLGDLRFAEGYQIKLENAVTGFQFCSTLTRE